MLINKYEKGKMQCVDWLDRPVCILQSSHWILFSKLYIYAMLVSYVFL
uniref:Uncharacterized protein n=1 Tax=Arundo donax TaxID=35708 RepID=A0A0A9BXX5_ARUDO